MSEFLSRHGLKFVVGAGFVMLVTAYGSCRVDTDKPMVTVETVGEGAETAPVEDAGAPDPTPASDEQTSTLETK